MFNILIDLILRIFHTKFYIVTGNRCPYVLTSLNGYLAIENVLSQEQFSNFHEYSSLNSLSYIKSNVEYLYESQGQIFIFTSALERKQSNLKPPLET